MVIASHYSPCSEFWHGKRVVLTGNTGFKGAWLGLWLKRLGASVTGIGLPPSTAPNLLTLIGSTELVQGHDYFKDLRDAHAVADIVQRSDPEIVFHLAAQSLVRSSYRDPLGTFATNVQGTANLLDALRSLKNLRVVVAVTTDKVYRNLEYFMPYRETDDLGGHDPYSASKAATELVVACYRDAFLAQQGVAIATARAGNVIGGGDWSEERLIPDAVRAWSNNRSLIVRRPDAIRPWQHVLEPLSAYLLLSERLWHDPMLAGAYNFGPYTNEAATVKDVISQAQKVYGRGEVVWGDGREGPHEANWLTLEIAKARHLLGYQPRWTLGEAIDHTIMWYRLQIEGVPARRLCEDDITDFCAA
jgi:CDP-glucose 4,6-dehydratase